MTEVSWPAMFTPVDVVVGAWPSSVPSHIVWQNQHELAVKLPDALPAEILGVGVGVGEEVAVSWVDGDGAAEVDAVVVETLVDESTWRLRVTMLPVIVQRRDYVRLAVEMVVRVGALTGRTLDISEGGARCALPTSASILTGAELPIVLELDDAELRTEGIVVRTGPAPADGEAKISIHFSDLASKDADRVRRFIFAEQMRRRAR